MLFQEVDFNQSCIYFVKIVFCFVFFSVGKCRRKRKARKGTVTIIKNVYHNNNNIHLSEPKLNTN